MSTRLWQLEHQVRLSDAATLFDYAPGGIEQSKEQLRPFQKQLEGVVALHNLLCRQRYAYLADEVGTGKTLIALGLAGLLLARKPNARVVVVVPKHGVANQWARDWQLLVNHVLKLEHLGLREPLLWTPTRPAEEYLPAGELLRAIEHSDRALPIISLYAFRFLQQYLRSDPKDTDPTAVEQMKQQMRPRESAKQRRGFFESTALPTLNKHLHEVLGRKRGIDLLIVDEAQCLRYPDNLTNTTLAGLLGLPSPTVRKHKELSECVPLVDAMLMLSATPMHRQKEDLYRQLSYIQGKEPDEIATQDVKSYLIRRFRRFGEYTKYHYRNEVHLDAAPEGADEHLFLAMSQKLLEACLHAAARGGRGRFELGFLETFESYGEKHFDFDEIVVKDENDSDQPVTQDLETEPESSEESPVSADAVDRMTCGAPEETDSDEVHRPLDHVVLEALASTWKNTVRTARFPAHPKFAKVKQHVADQLRTSPRLQKTIIFVRRIKGTTELAAAAQSAYNEYLWEQLDLLFDGNIPAALREEAERRAPGPKVNRATQSPLQLFAARGQDTPRKGSLADWARRVRAANTMGFASFFHESPVGAIQRHPSLRGCLESIDREEAQERFAKTGARFAAKDTTADRWWLDHLAGEFVLLDALASNSAFHNSGRLLPLRKVIEERLDRYERGSGRTEHPLPFIGGDGRPTLSLWDWLVDYADRGQDCGYNTYLDHGSPSDLWRWELQKRWIKAILESGEGLLVLFAAAGGSPLSPPELARLQALVGDGTRGNLCSRVLWRASQLMDAELLAQVKRQVLDKKLRDKPDRHLALEAQVPNALKARNFARPVSGTSGREGLLSAQQSFNTPGFPDVLVATDIMREGIDLHLFCRTMMHYGIAWSAGDLEQRIGRCDRLFSRAFRLLRGCNEEEVGTALVVTYPVLMGSVDERQVAKIITDKLCINTLMDTQGETSYMDPQQRWLTLARAFSQHRKFCDDQKAKDDPYDAKEFLEPSDGNAAAPWPSDSVVPPEVAHQSRNLYGVKRRLAAFM